jgi:hypothetical protein
MCAFLVCLFMLFQLHRLLNFSWYDHEDCGLVGCVLFGILEVDW